MMRRVIILVIFGGLFFNLLAIPAAAAPAPKQPLGRDNPSVRAALLTGLALQGIKPGLVSTLADHVYIIEKIEIEFGPGDDLVVAVKMKQLR